MRIFAQIISFVFQPLFLPVYAYLLYVLIQHPTTHYFRMDILFPKERFLHVLFLLTVLMPGISLLVMKRSKIISSLQLGDRKERIPVLILILVLLLP